MTFAIDINKQIFISAQLFNLQRICHIPDMEVLICVHKYVDICYNYKPAMECELKELAEKQWTGSISSDTDVLQR